MIESQQKKTVATSSIHENLLFFVFLLFLFEMLLLWLYIDFIIIITIIIIFLFVLYFVCYDRPVNVTFETIETMTIIDSNARQKRFSRTPYDLAIWSPSDSSGGFIQCDSGELNIHLNFAFKYSLRHFYCARANST